MEFWIAQIVGIITTVVALVSVQFKDEKIILLGEIIANFTTAISFGLLGGLSGAWVCVLAAFQSTILFVLNKSRSPKRKMGKYIVSVVFAIAYIIGSIITYSIWQDIIVCVCALIYTYAVMQDTSKNMRTVIGVNMLLWIIYDLIIGAYTNMITHLLSALSVLTAKFRLDRKKK